MRGDLQIEFIESDHQAQAYDRLIVTRDRQFCKTFSLKSPMSLASSTRQRPPQSGFVQTGLGDINGYKGDFAGRTLRLLNSWEQP